MAVLSFNNYEVLNMYFEAKKEEDNSNDTADLNLAYEFSEIDDNKFSAIIATQNNTDFPYTYQIIIRGFFTYNSDDDLSEPLGLNGVKPNALAILYPYLRQTLSQLVTLSGNHQIVLPTLNMFDFVSQTKETSFNY